MIYGINYGAIQLRYYIFSNAIFKEEIYYGKA